MVSALFLHLFGRNTLRPYSVLTNLQKLRPNVNTSTLEKQYLCTKNFITQCIMCITHCIIYKTHCVTYITHCDI